MFVTLLIASTIVLLCIFSSKFTYRLGVPALLIFLVLGMLLGSDGVGIEFDDFQIAESVALFALAILIFYGGLGTRWATAKPMVVKASLLSSLGTIMTAIIAGLFCTLILKVDILYGLLFGAVIGSTDAASVFSILRSRKLNLKHGLAPLLEVESGSNDPFAHILTISLIFAIDIRTSGGSFLPLLWIIPLQLVVAIVVSASMAVVAVFLLKRVRLHMEGFYPILLLAIAVFSYAACSALQGNGLLCVYILGIVIGNSKILHKVSMVRFFDAISWLMQIMLFFVLGLLSFPSKMLPMMLPGFLISLIIIFVARPVAVFSILSWFKVPIKQQLFTAWVGYRGAASIVFAIIAVSALGNSLPYDLFHLVFFVALFSVLFQGTLTPLLSKKLKLVDSEDNNTVLKTFTDYFEESHKGLYEHKLSTGNTLIGKCIVDANIPENLLIIMIKRGDEVLVPKGSTEFAENDILMVSGEDFSFFSNSDVEAIDEPANKS